jgi:signal transduction histidine kinase/ActR/RegA family two-component response regulator
MTEANYKASGMPIGIIDAVDGSVLIGFGWQDICTLYHRRNAISAERCRESDSYIKDHLADGMPCEYVCKNGLRDIGIPITAGGEHLATLFLGQFFYEGESADRAFFIQQARQLGFDEPSYLAALARVPVISRRAIENIVQYNVALARFISDLAERALAQARHEEAVRDADRRKTEFMAVLSHELRNPLAPVQTALHLLERVDSGTHQARTALAVAKRQVRQLARMVDDLLDVTRLSRGKYQLQRKCVDLTQVVRDAVEDHMPEFVEHGLTLGLQGTSEPVWVDGDAARLSQVLGNLLRNAFKFTDPGGHVLVMLQQVGDQAVIRVRDDGIGVSPELVKRMFEPFVQADASLHRTRGGLGLGLALARDLIALHGGTVTAQSGGEEQGSEFIVTLPLTAEAVRVEPRSSHHVVGRRVLVIEDNEDAATMLQETLEIEGHEVHVSPDGLQGVEAALRLRPEVILCDIGLPGIDGYEVARRLRGWAETHRTLLVAVTGYTSTDDVRRAADAGFHHHFAKPPDLERLSRVVAGGSPPATLGSDPTGALSPLA